MASKVNQGKFICRPSEEILERIQAGTIDVADIIFTSDSHEIWLIKPDLTPLKVKSRVYVFDSIAEAESVLNGNEDTYPGQIVSIFESNKYKGYIVNINSSQRYYVTPVIELSDIDYNSLGNRPIINLNGPIGSPIIVSQLNTGVYLIKGQYKISSNDITDYSSSTGDLFIIDQSDEETIIKSISKSSIIDYSVSSTGIKSDSYITSAFLNEQGYVTQAYVDERFATLDAIIQDEVAQYVDSVVAGLVEQKIEEKFDAQLDEKIDSRIASLMVEASDSDIRSLFS